MGFQTNKVTNANVYWEGKSYLGKVASCTLPTIRTIDSDNDVLGMFGKSDSPAGIDKMEVDIKWNSYYPEAIQKSSDIYSSVRMQLRTHIEVYENNSRVEQKPVIIYLTVRPKEIPIGAFEQQTKVDLTGKLSCTYVKIEIGGIEQLEIDVEANIYKVKGEDKLAAYRSSLGI